MTSDRSVLPSKQREVTQAPALLEAPSAPGCGVVASSGSLRHAEAAGGPGIWADQDHMVRIFLEPAPVQ